MMVIMASVTLAFLHLASLPTPPLPSLPCLPPPPLPGCTPLPDFPCLPWLPRLPPPPLPGCTWGVNAAAPRPPSHLACCGKRTCRTRRQQLASLAFPSTTRSAGRPSSTAGWIIGSTSTGIGAWHLSCSWHVSCHLCHTFSAWLTKLPTSSHIITHFRPPSLILTHLSAVSHFLSLAY